MVLSVQLVNIPVCGEIAVLGRHFRYRHPLDQLVVLPSVILERLNRNKLQVPPLGKVNKL